MKTKALEYLLQFAAKEHRETAFKCIHFVSDGATLRAEATNAMRACVMRFNVALEPFDFLIPAKWIKDNLKGKEFNVSKDGISINGKFHPGIELKYPDLSAVTPEKFEDEPYISFKAKELLKFKKLLMSLEEDDFSRFVIERKIDEPTQVNIDFKTYGFEGRITINGNCLLKTGFRPENLFNVLAGTGNVDFFAASPDSKYKPMKVVQYFPHADEVLVLFMRAEME